MMRLYIMRHGDAAPRAASDALRPLTELGRYQARQAAEWLQAQPPEQIISSPFLRARQTAELVHQLLPGSALAESACLTPDDAPVDALQSLSPWCQEGATVLIVSHQPLVSDLATMLLGGEGTASVPFATASIAALDLDWPGALGELVWLRHV
jgi:phosphohistidine phosphatase